MSKFMILSKFLYNLFYDPADFFLFLAALRKEESNDVLNGIGSHYQNISCDDALFYLKNSYTELAAWMIFMKQARVSPTMLV
jgi:hypothetical protein